MIKEASPAPNRLAKFLPKGPADIKPVFTMSNNFTFNHTSYNDNLNNNNQVYNNKNFNKKVIHSESNNNWDNGHRQNYVSRITNDGDQKNKEPRGMRDSSKGHRNASKRNSRNASNSKKKTGWNGPNHYIEPAPKVNDEWELKKF